MKWVHPHDCSPLSTFPPASLTRAITKSVSRAIAAPGRLLPTVANNPSVASWEETVPSPHPSPSSSLSPVSRGSRCPLPTQKIIHKPLRFPPLSPQPPSLQNPLRTVSVSQLTSFPRPLQPSVIRGEGGGSHQSLETWGRGKDRSNPQFFQEKDTLSLRTRYFRLFYSLSRIVGGKEAAHVTTQVITIFKSWRGKPQVTHCWPTDIQLWPA